MHAVRLAVWRRNRRRIGKYRDYLAAASAKSCRVLQPVYGGYSGFLLWQRPIVRQCLALAGQWKSLKFTAAAFVAHGVWDILHVTEGLGANAGMNFPVLCVAYDWVIAGYLWWWLAPRTKTN